MLMLTSAAKTLDATISVATFANRCLVVPNTKCRRVPLLMRSKFAEQNHATTYTISTTTQFNYPPHIRREINPITRSRRAESWFDHTPTSGNHARKKREK
jgi:hypothetical protein